MQRSGGVAAASPMVHQAGASAPRDAGVSSYSGRTVHAAGPRRGGELACLRGVSSSLEAARVSDLAALPAPRRVAMRLRVRLAGAAGDETHRVVTPEVCDLAALRALVASRLGLVPAAVRLSLNGTDELAPGAAGGATLQVVGIAPGDLLYVLPPAAHGAAPAVTVPAAAPPTAAPALAPLTWQQPRAAAAPHAAQLARPAQPAQPSAEARRAACLRALEARGAAGAAAPATDSAATLASTDASTAPPAADDDAMDTSPAASDTLAPPTSVPGAFFAAPWPLHACAVTMALSAESPLV